ncbi:type II toxin-antitoxin system Phd/YefM family antitoxin [Sinimarinibacterium thermocellulolyticum]|uniref:Antitoxin n=1 Tax=Sinimarinibacterium thermocellulolyticum TaxID=3170016 RepID=A0ABV2AE95_9GAMM
MRTVSIADAKNRLTELLREVECGAPLAISRRGRVVAVLLADGEYQRLRTAAGSADFSAFLASWRARAGAGFEGVSPEELARWSQLE